jgi:hypothetical protein
MVWSDEPLANHFPSGLNLMDDTALLWPFRWHLNAYSGLDLVLDILVSISSVLYNN